MFWKYFILSLFVGADKTILQVLICAPVQALTLTTQQGNGSDVLGGGSYRIAEP